MATVWVDFDDCNKVAMPLILQEFGILGEFSVRGDRLSGSCPLPGHAHPLGKRNKSQFSANFRADLGRWLVR